jgi:hypothetical protein
VKAIHDLLFGGKRMINLRPDLYHHNKEEEMVELAGFLFLKNMLSNTTYLKLTMGKFVFDDSQECHLEIILHLSLK